MGRILLSKFHSVGKECAWETLVFYDVMGACS